MSLYTVKQYLPEIWVSLFWSVTQIMIKMLALVEQLPNQLHWDILDCFKENKKEQILYFVLKTLFLDQIV